MKAFPVSVVIPAYNAGRYIGEAIDSVLAQSMPVELIVVDDGSTDATAAIAFGYGNRVRCIRLERGGVSRARNRGLVIARHDLIAFLDADDRWTPSKLERQCAVLATRPDIDMVFGHSVEFVSDEPECTDLVARGESAPSCFVGTMLARRTLFESVGVFSEKLQIGEFMDWYGRAMVAGARALILDDVVYHRRIHRTNMTRLADDKREQYLAILRQHLNRRRSAT
jgi:glycosyltransferase involved in cell wall biosynthesis